jgi:hypothetical protein
MFRRLIGWLFRRDAGIGQPVHITGDMRVRFAGAGRARFRLQHAADRNGAPDDLSWTDVTLVSGLNPERAFNVKDLSVRGFLVEWIEDQAEIFYRRHTASWLRVVPFDDDKEAVRQCKSFRVSMVPM